MKIDISEVPELQQPAITRELETGATYAVVWPRRLSDEARTRLTDALEKGASGIRFLIFDDDVKFFKLERSE